MSSAQVSIVTVNFNDACGLEQTLASIAVQRSRGAFVESIVVDGASVDGSRRVIEDYRDTVDVAVSEPDRGIYDAMNKGLALASGDSVLFLNSGDRFFGGFDLRALQDRLDLASNVALCRCFQIHGDDAYLRPAVRFSHPTPSQYSHQAIFVPRIAFAGTRFDLSLPISADTKWKEEVAIRAPIQHCEVICSVFQLGGVSNRPGLAQVRTLLRQTGGTPAAFKGLAKIGGRLMLGQSRLNRLLYWRKHDRVPRAILRMIEGVEALD